ncbi:hypothetical protein D3C71_1510870 [compost metagenome]
MGFGKPIGAEAFQLAKCLLGEFPGIAVRQHTGDQLVLELADAAGELEGRHGFAQLVGLAGGKAGTDHSHLHRRFLKERHAKGL